MPKTKTEKSKLHYKPTPQELETNAQKALEEAEKMAKEPPKEEPKEEPEEKEVVLEEEKTIPETPEVDYKERYAQSTKEAQILYSKNKKMNEAMEKAGEIADPTDEELNKEYPDWEIMSDFEKKIAKDTYKNNRRFSAMNEATNQFKALDKWMETVDKFIDDPQTMTQFPDLDGKEGDFKAFAAKDTRVGIDLPDIVASFLYRESSKPKNKGRMFEAGTGGSNEKPKTISDKLSVEEAKQLRKIDYKRYTVLLRAGKIDFTNI